MDTTVTNVSSAGPIDDSLEVADRGTHAQRYPSLDRDMLCVLAGGQSGTTQSRDVPSQASETQGVRSQTLPTDAVRGTPISGMARPSANFKAYFHPQLRCLDAQRYPLPCHAGFDLRLHRRSGIIGCRQIVG